MNGVEWHGRIRRRCCFVHRQSRKLIKVRVCHTARNHETPQCIPLPGWSSGRPFEQVLVYTHAPTLPSGSIESGAEESPCSAASDGPLGRWMGDSIRPSWCRLGAAPRHADSLWSPSLPGSLSSQLALLDPNPLERFLTAGSLRG